MERTFASTIEIAGANALPSGRDFMATWGGIGTDLPPEHKIGVLTGTADAWNGGDSLLNKVLDSNGHLARRISLYETALEDASWVTLTLKTPMQGVFSALGVGNEKAIMGREGWLFFTPGVESLTQAGFLESEQLHLRTRTSTDQPDPRKAIRDLHQQLSDRGIKLILVPAPIKPSVHPEYLTDRLDGSEAVRNQSMQQFLDEMAADGITVIDPLPQMMANKNTSGELQFLKTDTHWTPAAMQVVAQTVADTINDAASTGAITFTGSTVATQRKSRRDPVWRYRYHARNA